MKIKKTKLLPYNLQFFAEDKKNDNNDYDVDSSGKSNEDNPDNGEDQNSNKSGEKTFTQSQVSTMMAKEKNEGKRSILKSLGFKNEEEAKKFIEMYNKLVDSNKTEAEKNADDVKRANTERDESIARALAAENKLACLVAGVNKDCIDDVLAIALTKVSDDKKLEDVLKDMKKDKKYIPFFEGSQQGTGSSPGHQFNGKTSEKAGEYGKRLGSLNNNGAKKTESSFF